MAFESGLLVGLDSVTRQAYEANSIADLKRNMELSRFVQQQKEDERQHQKEQEALAQRAGLEQMDQLAGFGQTPQVSARPTAPQAAGAPPVQPPMPGQPSKPMMQAFGPQGQPGPGGQQPPPGGPQGPLGWKPSPSAPPSLGGMAGAGSGAPTGPPQVPPRPRDEIPPEQLYLKPVDFFKSLLAKHPEMSHEEAFRMTQASQPLRDKLNKEQMDQIDLQIKIDKAKEEAEKRILAEHGGPGMKDTTAMHDALAAVPGYKPGRPWEEQPKSVQDAAQKFLAAEQGKKGRFKGEGAGGGSGAAGGGGGVPGGVGSKMLQTPDGQKYAVNTRSGKAWKMDEAGKWEPINANKVPAEATGVGTKTTGVTNVVRQNIVRAGVKNSIARLDEIEKSYGPATTSSFFGQSAEGPVTRYAYGLGKSMQDTKQQKVDAAWASFIDEAIPVFTGGLRGSDAFRRFLIEQAPGPGDKPEAAKEKMRLIRANINGTSHAFFDKFQSSPDMWASGTKPEDVDQAASALGGGGQDIFNEADKILRGGK